jgi:hypothetical protein
MVTVIVALLDRLPQELVTGKVAVAEVKLHLPQTRPKSLGDKSSKNYRNPYGDDEERSGTWRRTLLALASSRGAAAAGAVAAMDGSRVRPSWRIGRNRRLLGFKWLSSHIYLKFGPGWTGTVQQSRPGQALGIKANV